MSELGNRPVTAETETFIHLNIPTLLSVQPHRLLSKLQFPEQKTKGTIIGNYSYCILAIKQAIKHVKIKT